MEYYFTEETNIDLVNSRLRIDGFEFNHLIRVLRKKVNDEITLTDGKRNIYLSKIVEVTKTEIVCEILNREYDLNEPELRITLFVSPLRNSDRFEFLIEKVVEIGVFEIYPLVSKYTVVKNSFSETKMSRLRKIVVAAMGQSQRCFLPDINNTISFDEMIKITEGINKKIVYYEHAGKKAKHTEEVSTSELCVLIGPEGGFDTEEIDKLIKHNWQVESLGERKLRAETAAIISVFEQINKYKRKVIL
ncbi:MAG: RsmE family RNA methyltransferase [Ignavibacteriota bacterium]